MSQVSITNIATNSWANRMADSVLLGYPKSKWRWHYEHGLLMQAITAIGVSGYENMGRKWVDYFVTDEGEIRSYQATEFNLDQINPGKLLIRAYQETREERYAAALRILCGQLLRQPRNLSGGFWHKQIYPNQMWLDGLYMAGPFLAGYAAEFEAFDLFDEVIRQFILMEKHARDPQTSLLYHAWDESRQQKWANPDTGCSPHFWGRSIGWYMMALVDVLEILPPEHADYPTLIAMLNRISSAMTRYQDASSGLWYQVVNLPERAGNYLESSVSAMLAYSLAKAVRKNWIASEYLSVAKRAYRGLLENMLRMDTHGRLTLEGTCSVAGLGGEPYRDGSYEYYVREPVAPNDFKGVGPFILAALEMEKEAAA